MERIEAYPRSNWREKAMEQQAAKANNSSKATEHRNDAVNGAFTVPRAQPSAGLAAHLQEPAEPIDGVGILVAVQRRQAATHIILYPFVGECAPFSKSNDAARLQVTQQCIY